MLRLVRLALLSLGLVGFWLGRGQVLARPGWAGSGVVPEAWWLRAVFYRVDPTRFQDSDGDGHGDIPGIVQRLDYLQSLGVDALLLDGPVPDDQLGDLVREASGHHLRVLTTLRPAADFGSRDVFMKAARASLSAGSAGLWVPRPSPDGTGAPGYPGLIAALRVLLQSFPGERVLLTDETPAASAAPAAYIRPTRHSIDPGAFGAARGGVLVATASLATTGGDTSRLRGGLAASNRETRPGLNPLLTLSKFPARDANQALADAVMLLGGRGAVMLNFGQELGLDTFPAEAADGGSPSLPVMQWTPSNRTQAPVEGLGAAPGRPNAPATEFGSYHPYVRPPRQFTPHESSPARVVPDANLPVSLPDPDSLPGFTTGPLPAPAVDSSRLNVTAEDRDPSSLLNAYRQLLAVHHGNATVRNGDLHLLDNGAQGVITWLRRAPGGSRTVADVIGVVNLSDRSSARSLTDELQALGVRSGPVHALFASPAAELTGETTDHLNLPPHAVLLGELSGVRAESPRHRGKGSKHGYTAKTR